MPEPLASDTATADPTVTSYNRNLLVSLLDRYDLFSRSDARKAASAILAIALLRADTPLALEALLRNGVRDEDLARFTRLIDARGYAELGFFQAKREAVRSMRESDALEAAQSLKTQLQSLAKHHDPEARLARVPLLSRLSAEEFGIVARALELGRISRGESFSPELRAGYTWFLRGGLQADGHDVPLAPGSLLSDHGLQELVGGDEACHYVHLSFRGGAVSEKIAAFGRLSAEVEWSRMLWSALSRLSAFEGLSFPELADAIDGGVVVRSVDAARALSWQQPWIAAPLKSPQAEVERLPALTEETLARVCPAILWTEAAWDGLVDRRPSIEPPADA